MQEKEIQISFQLGAIKSCVIASTPRALGLGSGYIIMLTKKVPGKPDEQVTVEKRARLAKDKSNNHVRVFKTIDSAVSFLHKIGFRKISVEIEDFVTWNVKRSKEIENTNKQ